MGRELVAHVIEAGHEVTVWNRSADVTAPFVARGARAAGSVAEAITGADTIVTVLFGPDAVRETVLAQPAPPAGAMWIDITTIAPTDARAFAAAAAERGLRYVHAPVIGSLGPARARALGVALGGASGDVAAARTITDLWSDRERIREFDSADRAATAKLIANLSVAVAMQGLTEALRLGRAGGLDLETVFACLDRTPFAPIVAVKGEMVRAGGFDDTQFSANALGKDLGLMLSFSGDLPAVASMLASLQEAQAAGLGESDFSVVARGERG